MTRKSRNPGRLFIPLILLLSLSGCAETLSALRKTPLRTQEAFSDPIRRLHIGVKSARVASAAVVVVGCTVLLSPTLVGILACPALAVAYDFILYEFILEPISKDRVRQGKPSLQGPYWETGPQDNEIFIYP